MGFLSVVSRRECATIRRGTEEDVPRVTVIPEAHVGPYQIRIEVFLRRGWGKMGIHSSTVETRNEKENDT